MADPEKNKHINIEFTYGVWNKWTSKSKNCEFKSFKKAIGDGEAKLALEFETQLLGQNSIYDMNVGSEKWEVKKLDHKSFNSGKIGMTALEPILIKINESIDLVKNFEARTDNKRLSNVRYISKLNELCENKCKKDGTIHVLFKEMHDIREQILRDDELIECFDIITGQKNYIKKDEFYKRAIACNVPDEVIKNKIGMFSPAPKHEYFEFPDNFLRDLSALANIFSGYVLVFVDETLGFYPMKDPEKNIKFVRITRGCPRFTVDLH